MIRMLIALVLGLSFPAIAQAYAEQEHSIPVRQITCPGNIHSTAVAIAPNRLIGAEHGFAAGGCGTQPIWYDRDYDLYIGETTETISNPVAVSCEGVLPGQSYQMIGYERTVIGRALPGYRTVQTETGTKDNMIAIEGGAEVGMSGGAVINQNGALVGIITSTNGQVTFVREFSTTSLCAS